MELRSHSLNNDSSRRVEIDRAQASKSKKSDSASAGGNARPSDSVDLSATARLFSEDMDVARMELIDSLRAAYESGTLNTRERIERAAQNLLAGE